MVSSPIPNSSASGLNIGGGGSGPQAGICPGNFVHILCTGLPIHIVKLLKAWWARGDSNARPLPCQGTQINHLGVLYYENRGVAGHEFGPQMDRRATPGQGWTSHGPHVSGLGSWRLTCFRARGRPRDLIVVTAQQHFISLSGMVTMPPLSRRVECWLDPLVAVTAVSNVTEFQDGSRTHVAAVRR
jgi:hypothetical protein